MGSPIIEDMMVKATLKTNHHVPATNDAILKNMMV